MSNLSVPLVNRAYLLQVGPLQVRNLRVVFSVTKNLTKDSNRADVKVYNLSHDSRGLFAKDEPQDVLLFAGYGDSLTQIFTGSMSRSMSYNEGVDWITEVRAGDGLSKIKALGTPVSATNTSAKQEIEKGLATANIAPGNFAAVMATKDPKKMKRFASIKAQYDYIQELAKALDLDLSIQDGVAQFLQPGKIASRDVVELSARSGMIGSPQIGKHGLTKVKALIQPKLTPGYGVHLVAREVKGFFRIETTKFSGDNFGQDWYADLELSSLDAATLTIPEAAQ